jgi:hypothetical protein
MKILLCLTVVECDLLKVEEIFNFGLLYALKVKAVRFP